MTASTPSEPDDAAPDAPDFLKPFAISTDDFLFRPPTPAPGASPGSQTTPARPHGVAEKGVRRMGRIARGAGFRARPGSVPQPNQVGPTDTNGGDPSRNAYRDPLTARTSNLRPYLAGAAPGLWASNHLEEAQHCTSWNFAAVRALAKMFSGSSMAVTQVVEQPDSSTASRRLDPFDPLNEDLKAYKARKRRFRREQTLARRRALRRQAKALILGKALPAAADSVSTTPTRRPLPDSAPIVRFLKRPNPNQSLAVFLFQMGQQIGLTGSALVWIVRNQAHVPKEMYIIPTGLCTPQPPSAEYPIGSYRIAPLASYAVPPDGDGFFGPGALGSLLTLGGVVDGRHVRAVRWPHPLYLSDGLSNLSAGALQTDISDQIDRATWSSFYNGARPGLVFSWTDPDGQQRVSDTEKEAFRQDLRNRNNGAQNFGRDLIVPPGMRAENIDRAPAELEYVQGRTQAREHVLAMHGTPPIAAGVTEAGSYAAYYAALKQYVEITVQPTLNLVSGELTHEIGPDFGDGLEITFKAASVDDPQILAARIDQHLKAVAITKNEYRHLCGMPPLDGPEGENFAGQPPLPPPAPPGQDVGPDGRPLAPPPGGQGPPALDPDQPGRPDQSADADQVDDSPDGADQTIAHQAFTDVATGLRDPSKKPVPGARRNQKSYQQTPYPVTRPETHPYSGVLATLPEPYASQILRIGRGVRLRDLADQKYDSLETLPHVTLQYGLLTDDAAEVAERLRGCGPIFLTFGKLSCFHGDEHDVLKVAVEPHPSLARLRGLLDDLDKVDGEFEFNPHATVAYLVPGAGYDYVGEPPLQGVTLKLSKVQFNDRRGRVYEIDLNKDRLWDRRPPRRLQQKSWNPPRPHFPNREVGKAAQTGPHRYDDAKHPRGGDRKNPGRFSHARGAGATQSGMAAGPARQNQGPQSQPRPAAQGQANSGRRKTKIQNAPKKPEAGPEEEAEGKRSSLVADYQTQRAALLSQLQESVEGCKKLRSQWLAVSARGFQDGDDYQSLAVALAEARERKAEIDGKIKSLSRDLFLKAYSLPKNQQAKLSLGFPQDDYAADENGPLAYGPADDRIKSHAREAVAFLSKILKSDVDVDGFVHVRRNLDPRNRSHYRNEANFGSECGVYMDSDSRGTPTVVHELGHMIEDRKVAAKVLANAFLDSRLDPAENVRMQDRFPENTYAAHEVGNKDDFEKLFGEGSTSAYYAGKRYKNGDTEALSMGVEALYTEPVGFAARDPEYFNFVMKALQA